MPSLITYLKRLFTPGPGPEVPQTLPGNSGLDVFFHRMADQAKLPGISVTILHQGKIALQKGYGYADLASKKQINPQTTLLRTASISKPIAATALLKMVEQGQIDLDASLYEYLPDFPRKSHDFSLRQLASHTAGIRGYRGKEFALNQELSIKDGLEIFQDDPLLFRPGTAYHYNSFDWVLLSAVMEEVAGMPFADYVYRQVLVPLHMNSTLPENAEVGDREVATFYTRGNSGFRKAVAVNNQYKLAGGGYLSTSADIARLGQGYLNGEIGHPRLVAEFLQSQAIAGEPTYYGLGWEVSMDHMGGAYYGHTGNSVGAFSKLQVYPDHEVVIAMLVNCTNPGLDDEMRHMTELLHMEYGNSSILGNATAR